MSTDGSRPLQELLGSPNARFFFPDAAVVVRLYARSGAEQWKLNQQCFARALERSAASRFRGSTPNTGELTHYLESLYLEDLALACACREGLEPAWEFFMNEYRQELYRAARAIAGGSGGEERARELADSLYADLYGLRDGGAPEPNGESAAGRKSLFNYFHGRSKLSTWLRAVLAQRHVDRFRAERRTESLDTPRGAAYPGGRVIHPTGSRGEPAADPDRAKYLALLESAFGEALSALGVCDRLRLAYYYVHGKTLAEIGRILGEHEATVSRQLDKTRRALRDATAAALRRGSTTDDGVARRGLDDGQIELCFRYALEDWPLDLSRSLGVAPDAAASEKSSPKTVHPSEG